jgi:hypothetical protein
MAAATPGARLCGEAVELTIPSLVHVPRALLAAEDDASSSRDQQQAAEGR